MDLHNTVAENLLMFMFQATCSFHIIVSLWFKQTDTILIIFEIQWLFIG
jgi:hypothetical protein